MRYSFPLPAIFITATGTEMGKTFVAAGLIACLRRRGRRVAALKPVLSGFNEDEYTGSDPALLLKACGVPMNRSTIAAISPWRFRAPLSPDMAGRAEGKKIDFAELSRFCRQAIFEAEDLLVIEGIGGLMVPFNETSTVADLIETLRIPLILVAGTYLGSLNHTLSAVEVAKTRGLAIAAIVLNETPDSSVPITATRASLKNFCGTVPIVPLIRGLDTIAFEQLADCIGA